MKGATLYSFTAANTLGEGYSRESKHLSCSNGGRPAAGAHQQYLSNQSNCKQTHSSAQRRCGDQQLNYADLQM